MATQPLQDTISTMNNFELRELLTVNTDLMNRQAEELRRLWAQRTHLLEIIRESGNQQLISKAQQYQGDSGLLDLATEFRLDDCTVMRKVRTSPTVYEWMIYRQNAAADDLGLADFKPIMHRFTAPEIGLAWYLENKRALNAQPAK